MRKGKTVRLGAGLDRFAGALNRRSSGVYFASRIVAVWEELAGPAVAEHTTGVNLRQGQLEVLVDSPVWRTELSALSEPYREALNTALGKEMVNSIRFTVSRKVKQARRSEEMEGEIESFYKPDQTPSVPLSSVERSQVELSAEAIKDPDLRDAVVRATVANLEWKKGVEAQKGRETPREGS